MILIGSRAIEHQVGGILKRDITNSDYDIIATPDEFKKLRSQLVGLGYDIDFRESSKHPGKYTMMVGGDCFEVDATENPSNIELRSLKDSWWTTYDFKGMGVVFDVPSFSLLYTTKRAHANFNVHFEKTFRDLVNMQAASDSILFARAFPPTHVKYRDLRKAEAKERFGKIQDRIKLNVPNEKFFAQSKHCRELDHDELHKLVAIDGAPAYLSCKRDMTLAKLERDMFEALPDNKKIRLPIEESLVIGMEREYISKLSDLNDLPPVSEVVIYRKGLMKLVRDLSKGWFQDYCLDNINTLWNHREPWFDKLKNQISTIKVQDA